MQRIQLKIPPAVIHQLGGHAKVQEMVGQVTIPFVKNLVTTTGIKEVIKYIKTSGMLGTEYTYYKIPGEVHDTINEFFNRKRSEVMFIWIKAYLNTRVEDKIV